MSSSKSAGETTKATVRPRRVIDTGSRCAASINSPKRFWASTEVTLRMVLTLIVHG
jgi:hypothetical protein